MKFQYASPFLGNFNYVTSDIVTGNWFITNSQPAPNTIIGTVLAPPNSISFSIFVSSVNLGVTDATNWTSIPANGVQTFPAGQTAPSFQALLSLMSTNGGGSGVSGTFVTNAISAALPTNFWSPTAITWISNLVVAYNVNTNRYTAGTLMGSSTNATGLVTFTANVQTNGFTQVVGVATNQFLFTNALPGITNGFVTSGITNGLAGTNYAVSVTNGYTGVVFVNTNQFLFTNLLPGVTNTFLEATGGQATNLTQYSNFSMTNAAGFGWKMNVANINGQLNFIPMIPGSTFSSITMTTNGGISSFLFTGNGAGLTNLPSFATSAITNAYPTNNSVVTLVGQSLFIPTNFDTFGGSNTLFALNAASSNALEIFNSSTSNQLITINASTSNRLQSAKIDETNGFGTGLTASNATLQGNTVFNLTATNIYSSTNVVKFINAGTSIATNGAFEYVAGNVYTNRIIGAYLTNNGAMWDFMTNSVILYTLNGASVVGTWTASSGSGSPLSCFGFYFNHDGIIDTGWISLTNISAYISNVVFTNFGNTIANQNGNGTNTFLTNAILSWNLIPATNQVNANVASLNFSSAAMGYGHVLSGSGFGAIISGGASNTMQNDGFGFMGGGFLNKIQGSVQNGCIIVGGVSNAVTGSDNYANVFGGFGNTITVGSDFSQIIGGQGNSIPGAAFTGISQSGIFGSSYSSVFPNSNSHIGSDVWGGESNMIAADWSAIMGKHATITNNNTFMWSDGISVNSRTNSTYLVFATNGVGINTNYPAGNALNVNGTINATAITISGDPLSTSVMPITNGNSYGQVASNITFLDEAAFGNSTNFYTSTNILRFLNAGISIGTNGTWEWIPSMGIYSNRLTTSIVTNNTTAWLQQTNGVSLYSLSGANPIGIWTAVSGIGTPLTVYGFYQVLDGQLMVGLFQSTNLTFQITNGVSVAIAAKVDNNNGRSTNLNVLNPITSWSGSTNMAFLPGANGILVMSNGLSYNPPNLDTAKQIATNSPGSVIYLGAGTYNTTNPCNSPLVVHGAGMYATTIVTWLTNLVNGPFYLTNGSEYSDFQLQEGYGPQFIGTQCGFFCGGGSCASVIRNVLCTNANSDIVYIASAITDGDVWIINSQFTSAFDNVFCNSGTGTGVLRLRDSLFYGLGPNLTPGFDGSQANSLNIGSATTEAIGCTFKALNTNSYNIVSLGVSSRIEFISCTFTNGHYGSTTFPTNIVFIGRQAQGSYLHLIACDIPPAGINVTNSGGTTQGDIMFRSLNNSTNYSITGLSANGVTNYSGITQLYNISGTSGTFAYYQATNNSAAGAAKVSVFTNTVLAAGEIIPVSHNCGISVLTGAIGVVLSQVPLN